MGVRRAGATGTAATAAFSEIRKTGHGTAATATFTPLVFEHFRCRGVEKVKNRLPRRMGSTKKIERHAGRALDFRFFRPL